MRVAGVAGPTLAHVVAGRVGAQRVLAARAGHAALVHVHAAGRRIGRVIGPALLAHAEGLAGGWLCAAERMRRTADALARLCAEENNIACRS